MELKTPGGYSTQGFRDVSKQGVCLHHLLNLVTVVSTKFAVLIVLGCSELVIESLLATKETRSGKYYQVIFVRFTEFLLYKNKNNT